MSYASYGFDAQCVEGFDHPAETTLTEYFLDGTGWDVVFVCEAHVQEYIDTCGNAQLMTMPSRVVSVYHWRGPWCEVLPD